MTVTPQVRKLEASANYGKFDIEPLDPGFGTTLGNTLRRVLLSSLWGAAVTSIQIDGVAHEFTAIPHVKEDVTEVILNLKKLRLKAFTEDPITLLLDVKGPAEVRASHIQATSDVEVVNPDLYICTLAAKGHLRMELNVERGKGYVPAERNKREGQPIGVIPIDSIFSPVEKANFVVEKTRVGQSTDFDRLIIEVWTDGTMSPEEAVSHSAELFTQHLNLFVKFRDSIEKTEAERSGEKSSGNRLMDTPIEELDLSVRAFNCLKANEIQTVGQLLQKREEELLALRNFGRKSLDEIKE
ncbi:MAG TPA: DNA-directed RNA polymerase subunit alpha, partial [Candidatus Dormibacteraeota bacterium]|nr:DNA-directed RNA polymerase subunit alpha [Candidatus Dormibacteraeota bacterium]